jgi:hypothetical protein
MGPERDFYERRQRTIQTERQPRIMVDFIKFNTYMIELVSGARELKNHIKNCSLKSLLNFYFKLFSRDINLLVWSSEKS